MVLSTEWSQVEVVDLTNEGHGLGFILVGGRSTGVVIKYLAPGGVADRDGRLQCGDHLLQIGEVNLRGFSSEQAATVLRQTGAQVRLIVARSVEPTSTDFHSLASHAPIIPTKLLSDPEELSRHLFPNPTSSNASGASATTPTSSPAYTQSCAVSITASATITTMPNCSTMTTTAETQEETAIVSTTTALPAAEDVSDCFVSTPDTELADLPLPPIPSDLLRSSSGKNLAMPSDYDIIPISILSPPPLPSLSRPAVGTPLTAMGVTKNVDHIETVITGDYATTSSPGLLHLEDVDIDCMSDTSSNYIESPETETYQVKLRKNVYGLGITVAGYVCQEEDLSGIFVKSIIEGSAAEMSRQIQINDRIVAVDGRTLSGVTNHQAVEMLRNTDIEVVLTLERFLRGRKYEHLQVALTEIKGDSHSQLSLPPSPSIATLSWLPPKSDADSILTDGGGGVLEGFPEFPSHDTVESNMSNLLDRSFTSYNSSVDRFNQAATPTRTPTTTTPTPTSTTTPEGKTIAKSNGSVLNRDASVDVQDVETEAAKLPVTQDQNHSKYSGKKQLNGNASQELIIGNTQNQIDALDLNVNVNVNVNVTEKREETSIAKAVPTAKPVTAVAVADSPSTSPNVESLKVTWKSEFPESEIIVADISKLSGLGISLEGTVDVECGVEKRPHHYIRSILEDGPVGKQGILKPGDELLQVNEHKLQGLKHTEVVKILKELPTNVKLVCARGPTAPSIINTSQNPEAFETRSILPGGVQSIQNLLSKAQSESSLYTSSTATLTDQHRSKSLENISGLALWCADVTIIEIEKTEQGFGFSILDYQDPLDPEGTVIVIRGLIRGGAAEATNEIFPGDRLVSVGHHCLQGLDLDEAVHILKGMPVGKTKLGICRPLSTSDSNSQIASPSVEADSPST